MGEGRGRALSFRRAVGKAGPHPGPLPEYQEREGTKLRLPTTPNRSDTVTSTASMIDSETEDDSESHAWVRSHVIGFFATIGVVIGLVIADSKIEEIIGGKAMPLFRTVLL